MIARKAPTLFGALLGGSPADACGVLHYGADKASVVSIGFTASQPANFANFSFAMVRGVTPVTLPAIPPTSGPVNTAVLKLYVAATISNGWSRQSEYDTEALLGFALTP